MPLHDNDAASEHLTHQNASRLLMVDGLAETYHKAVAFSYRLPETMSRAGSCDKTRERRHKMIEVVDQLLGPVMTGLQVRIVTAHRAPPIDRDAVTDRGVVLFKQAAIVIKGKLDQIAD